MKLWKALLPVVLISLIAVPCAAEERIAALLRSMLDGGPLPTEKVFDDTVAEEYFKGLPADDVRKFLPLARTLLQDSRPEARRYGLSCFLAITTSRFSDSEALLDPYVSDLLRILDDHADPLRTMALFVVSHTAPKVSPRALRYMEAHLSDKDNTTDETGALAWILLRVRSERLTHDVVAFVRKLNNNQVTEQVLRSFHVHPAKDTEAIAFIGESLDSQDEWVRRRAVEAIEVLSVADRDRFLNQLTRLSTDPKEPDEIRSAAARALKKKE